MERDIDDTDQRRHAADDVIFSSPSSTSSTAPTFLGELKVIIGLAWPTVGYVLRT